MKLGIYPGSFDPLTNGHIDVIKRSKKIVDNLIIAKNQYGAVYWPEFGFNSLVDLRPGQGYQVRMYYSSFAVVKTSIVTVLTIV